MIRPTNYHEVVCELELDGLTPQTATVTDFALAHGVLFKQKNGRKLKIRPGIELMWEEWCDRYTEG